jgi:hypothetical protein
MFSIQPFAARELGNSSFLIADPDAGQAAVVDPFRDVDRYLSYAEEHGLSVVRALDFLSQAPK